jgi:putative phosphoesterase
VRLGLISDVHGNALALEAVLAELAEEAVDRIVCLGDIAPGPDPVGAIRLLRASGADAVAGNWDEWLLGEVPPLPGDDGPKLADQGQWWSARLGEAERRYLAQLPATVEIELDGNRVLCVHGSPRSATEDIWATTPDVELAAALDGVDASVVATGHTHVQLVRMHGSKVVVNPGSVGLPFNSWPPNGRIRMSPWAEYAIVTAERGRISTELRRTGYDVGALLDRVLRSDLPHARWWADGWLVQAPAEA